jgi:MFS family permease
MGASPETTSLRSTFIALVLIGFFARLSYGMARTPLLALFAKTLGATPAIIGVVVGMSTVTGIFFKAPAGTLSDVYGRRAALFVAAIVFGLMPFAYFFVYDYRLLIAIRFFHGFATAIYGPVAMAVIMDIAGERKGELVGWAHTRPLRLWVGSSRPPSAVVSWSFLGVWSLLWETSGRST